MDNLDQYIQSVVTKEIYEPENYVKTIKNSLNSNKCHNKYFNLYRVAIMAICLLFTSGIAYATYNYVKNSFNNRKGIETAINNGYIMNVNGEPVTSNDVSLSIDQILLDDYNLDISFELEFKNIELSEYVQLIKFENILISDENNNILYFSGNQSIFYNFVQENNLNIAYQKYNSNYINSALSVNIISEESKSLILACNISALNRAFPKSNNLYIYINNIVFCINNNNKIVNANWVLESSLSSSFNNRKSVKYTCENINKNKDIINMDVVTYTTGTNLKIEMKLPTDLVDTKKLKSLINKAKSEQQNSTKNVEYYNGLYMTNVEKEIYDENNRIYYSFDNIYIENSHGEKFYITDNILTDENFYINQDNTIIIYFNTLDMTTYNCTNNVILHFIYNSKEYSINLTALN